MQKLQKESEAEALADAEKKIQEEETNIKDDITKMEAEAATKKNGTEEEKKQADELMTNI